MAKRDDKPVVYIAGPISGINNYWEIFEAAEDKILAAGAIPLSPAHLPLGLRDRDYIRIDMAQIDAADLVLFLDGWEYSAGAALEMDYCNYTDKRTCYTENLEAAIGLAKMQRGWDK